VAQKNCATAGQYLDGKMPDISHGSVATPSATTLFKFTANYYGERYFETQSALDEFIGKGI